jgi:hypothetical protein
VRDRSNAGADRRDPGTRRLLTSGEPSCYGVQDGPISLALLRETREHFDVNSATGPGRRRVRAVIAVAAALLIAGGVAALAAALAGSGKNDSGSLCRLITTRDLARVLGVSPDAVGPCRTIDNKRGHDTSWSLSAPGYALADVEVVRDADRHFYNEVVIARAGHFKREQIGGSACDINTPPVHNVYCFDASRQVTVGVSVFGDADVAVGLRNLAAFALPLVLQK